MIKCPDKDQEEEFLTFIFELSQTQGGLESGDPFRLLLPGETSFNGYNSRLIFCAFRANQPSSRHRAPFDHYDIPQPWWRDFFGRFIRENGTKTYCGKHPLLGGAVRNDQLGALQALGGLFAPGEADSFPPGDDFVTPLTATIICRASPAVVSHLVAEVGVDPDKKDKYGLSPLTWAVLQNNLDLLACLLDEGADPNIAMTINDTLITKVIL